MRYGSFLFLFIFIPIVAHGADSGRGKGLLTAESFPNTFSDLSFVDRISVLREGYMPWESEYDAKTGKCISNCPFAGLTIEKAEDAVIRATAAATAAATAYQAAHPEMYNLVGQQQATTVTTQPGYPDKYTTQTQPIYAPAPNQQTAQTITRVPLQGETAPQVVCSPRNTAVPVNQTIPLGRPIIQDVPISSGFSYSRKNPVDGVIRPHNGIDYPLPSGTEIYSPAVGTVESAFSNSACGNGLTIVHSDGFKTGYCHLSRVLVKEGDKVYAGCPIAKSGNTGRSTGPHLHYIIYRGGTPTDPEQFVNRI